MVSNRVMVIIPAYNEENSITKVIRQIKNNSPQADIVVVNDGSKDNTVATARAEGVVVIDLPYNLGIGGAMQTGYLYAYLNNYDVAVQIDADGQHNPADLPKLLQKLTDCSCDMVVGSRYVARTDYKSSKSRRVGMVFFSAIIKLITGCKIKDTTSGFRAVNRKIIEVFATKYPTDYPEVEVLVLLQKLNFKIVEIPVQMENRQAGHSSITPLRGIYYMLKVTLALVMNTLRSQRSVTR